MVLLLTVVIVILVAALVQHNVRIIFTLICADRYRRMRAVALNCLRETVQMKVSTSYGPVKVQSQTATQEPVYELADTIQPREDIRTV